MDWGKKAKSALAGEIERKIERETERARAGEIERRIERE